jgi:iron complex transport system substrate-binding protein
MNRLAFRLVVLSCISLAIMPAVADDYTLGIFGNANMDDTVDEDDIEYVEGIIDGTIEETELADANYDGRIDEEDIAQIELIITEEEKELTIIDSADRIVTVEVPVGRIAFLNTNIAEILCVLDAEDKVVGVPRSLFPKYAELYPVMAEKPAIGGFTEPNYEKIVEVDPQILINYPGKVPELEKTLEDTDIKVILMGFDHKGIDFDQEVEVLGYILGKQNEADEFINWKKEYLNVVKSRTDGLKDEEKVRVFIGKDGIDYLFQTATQGTGWNEVVTTAGGKNIAADLGTELNFVVDPEWVLEQNPAAIILIGFTATGYQQLEDAEAKAIREVALNDPTLKDTDAGKQERVYILNHYLSTVRLDIGICYVAKWLYPELFKDLHPDEINREYFERFLHAEYKGAYAYPLPE